MGNAWEIDWTQWKRIENNRNAWGINKINGENEINGRRRCVVRIGFWPADFAAEDVVQRENKIYGENKINREEIE